MTLPDPLEAAPPPPVSDPPRHWLLAVLRDAGGTALAAAAHDLTRWAPTVASQLGWSAVALDARLAGQAYDLSAGTLIVRGAGGEVTDLAGNPIDALLSVHRG